MVINGGQQDVVAADTLEPLPATATLLCLAVPLGGLVRFCPRCGDKDVDDDDIAVGIVDDAPRRCRLVFDGSTAADADLAVVPIQFLDDDDDSDDDDDDPGRLLS